MADEEKWDLIIRPKIGWFEINFREIWRYRDLVVMFVKRDFAAHYAQTVLGPVWHVIQPILTTLMFLLVFTKVANIPTDGVPPILFYMSGITIWNYFSFCLTTIASTFVINANIFGKVYFPRIILPISVVMSNVIRFGIQFSLLLITMIYFYFRGESLSIPFQYWIFIPAIIAVMAGFALGIGIVVASITTKYRDVSVLLTFAVQLYMYGTPIAYPMSRLESLDSPTLRWVIKANPLSPLVEAFRYCLFGKGTFTSSDLVYSALFVTILVVAGFILFNRVERRFMDTV